MSIKEYVNNHPLCHGMALMSSELLPILTLLYTSFMISTPLLMPFIHLSISPYHARRSIIPKINGLPPHQFTYQSSGIVNTQFLIHRCRFSMHIFWHFFVIKIFSTTSYQDLLQSPSNHRACYLYSAGNSSPEYEALS